MRVPNPQQTPEHISGTFSRNKTECLSALTNGQTELHSDTQVSVSSHTSLLPPRKGAAVRGPEVQKPMHMETACEKRSARIDAPLCTHLCTNGLGGSLARFGLNGFSQWGARHAASSVPSPRRIAGQVRAVN
jgi:hypothetical protein